MARVSEVHQLSLFERPPRVVAPAPAPQRPSGPLTPPPAQRTLRARPQPIVVRDPIADYLEQIAAHGKSRHTLDSTRLDLRQFERHLAPTPVMRADAGHAHGFIQWLATQRACRRSSLRRKIAVLKGFSQSLYNQGLARSDFAASLAYPTLRLALPEALAAEEIERLWGAAMEHSPLWGMVIAMLLETGVKRDELLALSPQDVLFRPASRGSDVVRLRRRRDAQRTRLRNVAITERLRQPLRDWLRALPPSAEHLVELSPRGVDYVVETCGHLAGLRPGGKLTPQLLRDTFALRELAMLLAQERELEASGADAARLDQVRREHDVRLLRQLGLSPTGQVAQRYRAALEAAAPTQRV